MSAALRNIRWLTIGLPVLPLLLIGGLLIVEAVQVGLGSASTVSEYRFGSESMLAHGGWAYRSRLNYVASGVAWGIAMVGSGVVLAWVVFARPSSRPWLISGLLAFALGLVGACLAVLAAWDHNPQHEFHSATAVNWDAVVPLAISWFLPVYGVVLITSRIAAGALLQGVRHA